MALKVLQKVPGQRQAAVADAMAVVNQAKAKKRARRNRPPCA